jgi:hypothetical protein
LGPENEQVIGCRFNEPKSSLAKLRRGSSLAQNVGQSWRWSNVAKWFATHQDSKKKGLFHNSRLQTGSPDFFGTETVKNIPKSRKIDQMVTKYTK